MARSPSQRSVPSETVGINAKLRKTYGWFESLIEKAKDAAIKDRRKNERTKGVQLSSEELVRLSDELESLQRQINPLDNRKKEIAEKLLAHWGHTGIEEIEGSLGRTLISASFEIAVDPDEAKRTLGDAVWQKVSSRVLQAPLLLREGGQSVKVRDSILQAARIKKLKVSVTPPSSRRPKSAQDDSDDEAA